MKRKLEYELLTMRQDFKDELKLVLDQEVVDFQAYKDLYIKWYICNYFLDFYIKSDKRVV